MLCVCGVCMCAECVVCVCGVCMCAGCVVCVCVLYVCGVVCVCVCVVCSEKPAQAQASPLWDGVRPLGGERRDRSAAGRRAPRSDAAVWRALCSGCPLGGPHPLAPRPSPQL